MLNNSVGTVNRKHLYKCKCSGADSGGGAPGARPPKKKREKKEREREREREKEREREREREERGSKEETIRSIRGKTSAEAFVISFSHFPTDF